MAGLQAHGKKTGTVDLSNGPFFFLLFFFLFFFHSSALFLMRSVEVRGFFVCNRIRPHYTQGVGGGGGLECHTGGAGQWSAPTEVVCLLKL